LAALDLKDIAQAIDGWPSTRMMSIPVPSVTALSMSAPTSSGTSGAGLFARPPTATAKPALATTGHG
jgi:hypothetical protein